MGTARRVTAESSEPVAGNRVACQQLGPFVGGHAGEGLVDVLPRMWPRRVRMRVVGRPHHVAHADLVAEPDGSVFVDERVDDLTVDVEARLLLQLRLGPVAVLPEDVVCSITEVDEPRGPGLDRKSTRLNSSHV